MHPEGHAQPHRCHDRPWQLFNAHDSVPWYSHKSHSQTDSVRFHCTSWNHGSSPLAAHTHLLASSVGLQSCYECCSVHCTTQPGAERGLDVSFSSCTAPNYLVPVSEY